METRKKVIIYMNIINDKIKRLLDDKITLIVGEIGIIFIILFLTFSKKEASIVIYYNEYPSDMITQIFYDIGSGYSEDWTYSCTAMGETEIVLPEEYLSSVKGIRVDFSNKEGKVCIGGIKLQKNGLNIFNIRPNKIIQRINSTRNLDCQIDNDNLVIYNNTIDGQVYFDDIFVEQIKNVYSIQYIEVIFAICFLIILLAVCYNRKRIIAIFSNLSVNKKRTLIMILFIGGIIYCYKDYILGDKLFIFNGIGSDSELQTYPDMYRYANLIENKQRLFDFDFTRGYGAMRNINAVTIFDWIILFGTANLPYLMGINQIIKIVLAFVLFYIYLKLLSRKEVVCYIGAASYALCGHMVIRQYWYSYSNEVVLSAFLLIALELAISKKRYGYLPFSLLLYCISLGEYNSVLVFGLVVGYTVFRYLELYLLNIKDLAKNILYSIMAYALAVLGSCAYLMTPLLNSLDSDRMKNGVSAFGIKSLFELQDLPTLKIAFIRTVSEGLEETSRLFHSLDVNILESPTFYCGILILMFIPVAICKLKNKRKVIAWSVVAIAIAYIVFPKLRYMANGFGAWTYKLSSFWIIILMLYYGTLGLEYWLDEETDCKYYTVYFIHIAIAIMSIILAAEQEKGNISMLILLISIIVFLDCIMLLRQRIDRRYISVFLVAIALIDLFANAYIFSTPEIAGTEDRISGLCIDNSIDYIKEIDGNAFYRIEDKDNRSPCCVALMRDYYGLVDYSGGASMNDNIHNFLESMNIARIQPWSNHYMTGLSNANELYNILSVKYVTTSEASVDNNYGLQLIDEINGKKIYENCNALPIGFCYNSYINKDELDKLEIQERRSALLDSCVVDNDFNDNLKNLESKGAQAYRFYIEGEEIPYEYSAELRKLSFNEIAEDKVIVLEFDMNSYENSFGALVYGNSNGNIGLVNVGSESADSQQSFVFTGNKISYFLCDVGVMSNIRVTIYDREKYYQKSEQYLQDRRNSEFECTSFSSNDIRGTVTNNVDAILYFAIPYDKGWNIYIDGKKADLLKVNYGFIGTYLTVGNHDIVLRYQIPYMKISIVISMVGAMAIIIWFFYWKKKVRKNTNDQNISSSTSIQ